MANSNRAKLYCRRSFVVRWQKIKDRLCFPLLMFLSSDQARSFRLTPIDEERTASTLAHCRGLLLDIGCGTNELTRCYRSMQGVGMGVDDNLYAGEDEIYDRT